MVLLKLIRVRETIFSLPLAYIGVLLVAEELPSFSIWFYVTIALVSARTIGMCLNRVLDKNIDARNPRTANRLLPSGQASVSTVIRYAVLIAILFIFSAYMLNELCFYLSFLALFLLITYSLIKRFSSTTHLYLGLTEACAPIGGALAVHPEFSLKALIMGLYVILWIAGFDIIYACQDYRFDRTNKLFSIPAKYGLKKALIISSAFHIAAVSTLFLTGIMVHANFLYWLCLLVVCCFFVWQHTLVSEKNLAKVNVAFFNANRNISLTVFLAFLLNFIF
jgi:4-hydroxybenzoate polyprenyltransferase